MIEKSNRVNSNPDLSYVDKIYYYIHHMDIGEEFDIFDPSMVTVEKRDLFRNHIIWFIQNELGHYRSFDLELSHDGTKFRKIAYGTASAPAPDPIFYQLQEMDDFFKDRQLPKEIVLTDHELIKDVPLFVNSHMDFIRNNRNKYVYMPYYQRLKKVVSYLKNI